MLPQQFEELNRRYRGRSAVVDPGQPGSGPWAGLAGQIKAINYNGLALVQFAGPDQGWHDIDLGRLQIVDRADSASPPGPS